MSGLGGRRRGQRRVQGEAARAQRVASGRHATLAQQQLRPVLQVLLADTFAVAVLFTPVF